MSSSSRRRRSSSSSSSSSSASIEARRHTTPNALSFPVASQHSARHHHHHDQVVGFDAEWCQSRPGESVSKVALVQLATENQCLLVQLAHLDRFPESLRRLLRDRSVLKVGVGVAEDARRLALSYATRFAGFHDVGLLANRFYGRTTGPFAGQRLQAHPMGLARLCSELFDYQIPKDLRVRTGNWGKVRLSLEQMQYAAIDAVAGREAFLSLASRGALAAPVAVGSSKEHRGDDEEEAEQQQQQQQQQQPEHFAWIDALLAEKHCRRRDEGSDLLCHDSTGNETAAVAANNTLVVDDAAASEKTSLVTFPGNLTRAAAVLAAENDDLMLHWFQQRQRFLEEQEKEKEEEEDEEVVAAAEEKVARAATTSYDSVSASIVRHIAAELGVRASLVLTQTEGEEVEKDHGNDPKDDGRDNDDDDDDDMVSTSSAEVHTFAVEVWLAEADPEVPARYAGPGEEALPEEYMLDVQRANATRTPSGGTSTSTSTSTSTASTTSSTSCDCSSASGEGPSGFLLVRVEGKATEAEALEAACLEASQELMFKARRGSCVDFAGLGLTVGGWDWWHPELFAQRQRGC